MIIRVALPINMAWGVGYVVRGKPLKHDDKVVRQSMLHSHVLWTVAGRTSLMHGYDDLHGYHSSSKRLK